MSAPPHAFILAGGRGTRFWPLSTHERPKQLLDFTGEGSLLALTVSRLSPLDFEYFWQSSRQETVQWTGSRRR